MANLKREKRHVPVHLCPTIRVRSGHVSHAFNAKLVQQLQAWPQNTEHQQSVISSIMRRFAFLPSRVIHKSNRFALQTAINDSTNSVKFISNVWSMSRSRISSFARAECLWREIFLWPFQLSYANVNARLRRRRVLSTIKAIQVIHTCQIRTALYTDIYIGRESQIRHNITTKLASCDSSSSMCA